MDSRLTSEQKMMHMVMFADPNTIPSFPTDPEVESIGTAIKNLFVRGVLTKMVLTADGVIVV